MLQEDFTIDDLKEMRMQIAKVFSRCYGYDLYVSSYVGNSFYTSLSYLIEKSLGNEKKGRIPKEGWFIKLFKQDTLSFHASNIQFIRDFLETYNSSPFKIVNGEIISLAKQNGEKALYSKQDFNQGLRLEGALVIDADFRQRVETLTDIHSHEDFYLAKKDNNCQWYGVTQNWDHPRSEHFEIVEKVKNCFNYGNRIPVVITGRGGTGKSTFLRRLAISLVAEKFKTLWIDDIVAFCDDDLEKICISDKLYLIIIEDWDVLKNDHPSITRLFSKVNKANNIRLIIGDRVKSNSDYRKYVGFTAKLTTGQNAEIIKKIAAFNESWKDVITHPSFNPNFYNAPIFFLLFVLVRSSEKLVDGDFTEVMPIFKEIIITDQKNLRNENQGLSKSLYYWACIYRDYNYIFSWETLINLANFYNDTDKVSHLLKFDLDNPLCQMLSYYFSVEKFIIPGLEHKSYCLFHHDTLVSEGLSNDFEGKLYFNHNILLEIVGALVQINEFGMAHDLLGILRGIEEWDEDIDFGLDKFILPDECVYFNREVFLNKLLKDLYIDAHNPHIPDLDWEYKLLAILHHFYDFNADSILIMLQRLWEFGCRAECIKIAYLRISEDDTNLLEITSELKAKFIPKSSDIDHNTKMKKFYSLIPSSRYDGPLHFLKIKT